LFGTAVPRPVVNRRFYYWDNQLSYMPKITTGQNELDTACPPKFECNENVGWELDTHLTQKF